MKLQTNQNFVDIRVDTHWRQTAEIKKLITAVFSNNKKSKRFFIGDLSFIADIIVSITIDDEDTELSSFGAGAPIKRRVRIVYEAR